MVMMPTVWCRVPARPPAAACAQGRRPARPGATAPARAACMPFSPCSHCVSSACLPCVVLCCRGGAGGVLRALAAAGHGGAWQRMVAGRACHRVQPAPPEAAAAGALSAASPTASLFVRDSTRPAVRARAHALTRTLLPRPPRRRPCTRPPRSTGAPPSRPTSCTSSRSEKRTKKKKNKKKNKKQEEARKWKGKKREKDKTSKPQLGRRGTTTA